MENNKDKILSGALSAPRERPTDKKEVFRKIRGSSFEHRHDRSRSRDRHSDGRRPPHRQGHNLNHNDSRGNNNQNQNQYRIRDEGNRVQNHFKYYEVVKTPPDPNLRVLDDDPRGADPTRKLTNKAASRGHGRNTESFDPASTLVRPDLRVQLGNPTHHKYQRPLKHDDVVIVPELFGREDDWSLYYKLVEEIRHLQKKEGEEKKDSNNKNDNGKIGSNKSDWIAWHEGAHLICKHPTGSPTFEMIINRLCEYFDIDKKNIGTRFNWYRDSSDWKPFHHDSAAFNPQRARNQNITVGVSFGAMRELAFIHATPFADNQGEKCKVYFPQTNNGVFSFGRDANIRWKHGVNALPPLEQDGKGRISIILWGLAKSAIEEDSSPPLLGSDGRGPHASKGRNHNQHHRQRNRPITNNIENNRENGRRNEKERLERWEPPSRNHRHNGPQR